MKSKRKKRMPFFVLASLIIVVSLLAIFGLKIGDTVLVKSVNDIRWGIDIRGGVRGYFSPVVKDGDEPVTNDKMDSAKMIFNTRLIDNNITDYEIYTDYTSHRIIVSFPWKEDPAAGQTFDPLEALNELGEMAELTFRKGSNNPNGEVLLSGADVKGAFASIDNGPNKNASAPYIVILDLKPEGVEKFAKATRENVNSTISIFMDQTCISSPRVNQEINSNNAQITGFATPEAATEIADKIKAGALPYKMELTDYNTEDPTLGRDALDVMTIAGVIAFAIICIFMILIYRMNGVVACIALLAQVAGSLALVSGFFPGTNSFTMTLPGLAGVILSIGMGVDANVINSERIREELRNGKTLEGAVDTGYKMGFSAIFDGNITVIIVAIILMGAFGPPDSIFAKIISPIFALFGLLFNGLFNININTVTIGDIYAFGYTLLVGIIFNFIMGTFVSHVMLNGAIRIKAFRKPWLYGGAKE